MSANPTVLQAMHEYAQALRGDWGDFDGRSNLAQMQEFIDALKGDDHVDWDIARWRQDMGVCPAGLGHWSGTWGYCDESCAALAASSAVPVARGAENEEAES